MDRKGSGIASEDELGAAVDHIEAALQIAFSGEGGARRIALASGAIVFLRPSGLMRDLTWGQLFIPFAGDGRWLTPIGAITVAALVLLLAWCWFFPRPLLDLRGWARVLVDADLVGALLLAVALGGVILAFATADPKVEVFSPRGRW